MYYILQDFEEYFEMKFMKKPVIVKKAPENPMDFRDKKKGGLPPKNVGTKPGSSSTKSYSTIDTN